MKLQDLHNINDYVTAYSRDPIRGILSYANTYLPRSIIQNYSKNELEEILTNEFLDNFKEAKGENHHKRKEAMHWTLQYIINHRHMEQYKR